MKLIKKRLEKEEMDADDFKNEFLLRRALINKKTFNKGSIEIEDIYADEYVEQCALAAGGDVVAQDLLSYWFKHGNPVLPENIDLSMKWEFLAAANGNKHTITKLALFLNYYYDSIIDSDYFDELQNVIDIYQENYQELLGQVICQFTVQELGINALELSKARTDKLEFNQLSMQRFTQAVNRAMPKVDEYFRKLIEKSKFKPIEQPVETPENNSSDDGDNK